MDDSITEIASEHEEIFYQSAEFWVGAAFILVVLCLFVPVLRAVKSLINQRINRIKNELQEAETLKLDAQKLYAEYERKVLNAQNEVEEIITNQQKQIEKNKQKKLKELDKLLKHKKNEADAKIEREYDNAAKEIKEQVYEKTLAILNQIIRVKLTKADYSRMVDNSISRIEALEFGKDE